MIEDNSNQGYSSSDMPVLVNNFTTQYEYRVNINYSSCKITHTITVSATITH